MQSQVPFGDSRALVVVNVDAPALREARELVRGHISDELASGDLDVEPISLISGKNNTSTESDVDADPKLGKREAETSQDILDLLHDHCSPQFDLLIGAALKFRSPFFRAYSVTSAGVISRTCLPWGAAG